MIQSKNNDVAGSEKELHINTCDVNKDVERQQNYSVYYLLTHLKALKPELNPICYLLALLGAHYFLHVSRIRVKLLTLG